MAKTFDNKDVSYNKGKSYNLSKGAVEEGWRGEGGEGPHGRHQQHEARDHRGEQGQDPWPCGEAADRIGEVCRPVSRRSTRTGSA